MVNKGTIATHGPNCCYDVFLSFRGLDTRYTLTGYLNDALRRTGFNTFMDDDGLQSGDQISLSLVKAIQESRISIVVLSQNYASSSWCLDELVKIVECMKMKSQLVWPIFYKVAPSDVRHQRNSYGEAMIKHENRFGNESEKVQKWRSALFEVANLKGWHFETGYEYEFIQRIVEMTITKSYGEQLDVGEHIIGHQSRMEELNSLLDIESRDTVCMVGIHGTSGIGKTTLAKALYNSIVDQFECAIFLEGVRETSNNMGLVQLQEVFLSKLLEGKINKLGSVDEGAARLKDRLHHRRVLLVLDDVDSEEQLEKLSGKGNWFGLGSRIIITTRDKHVLNVHDVEYVSLDSPPRRKQARRTSSSQFAIRSPPSLAADASDCIPSHSQTSMTMAMRNNHNKYLPEPMILKILLRLPVKSLLRFKCVSKSWLSLISDPNFAKSHFELSAAPTHRFLCYQGSATRVQSIDPDTLFHDDPAMVSLVLPLLTPPHLRIRGSCRGFIMLQDYWNFILWNPTTRVHKLIYYSHIESSVNDVYSFLDDALLYGFGYDASKDDYLIVIAWSDNMRENHFEYFSLRTNSWKKFEVTHPIPHMDPAFSPGFFLNGAIHWFAPIHGEWTILAFDLITRKFSEIPLPVPIAEDVEASSLQLLGGCLSMSFWTCDKKIEIWLMKEYKEQSSWTMYEIFDSHFVPIYFTKGGEIIGFDGNRGLMKYTDKGELLEYCAFGHYRLEEDTMYTESLLSLPSGPGEAGEDDQQ